MNEYTVIDNKGNSHALKASNDSEALKIMRSRYVNYIYSVLSSDSIIVVRPNGYILAYINTATGEQTVKQMTDWMQEIEDDEFDRANMYPISKEWE